MFELLLSIFCSYRNAQLAKRKGQNTIIWVIITMVAFFLSYFVGFMLMILIFYKGALEQTAILAFMFDRPLIVVTIMFFALGGYLLVRYILERMPDVKSSE